MSRNEEFGMSRGWDPPVPVCGGVCGIAVPAGLAVSGCWLPSPHALQTLGSNMRLKSKKLGERWTGKGKPCL